MKNLLNLGSTLSKTEQKSISGGFGIDDQYCSKHVQIAMCISDDECSHISPESYCCPLGNCSTPYPQ